MQRLLMRIGYRWVGATAATAAVVFLIVWYSLHPLLGPVRALLLSLLLATTLTLSFAGILVLGVLAGPLHERLRSTITANAAAGHSLRHLLGSDDFPALGGWSLEPDAAVALVRAVEQHQPQRILELGPGASTELLLRCLPAGAQLVALEHDKGWAQHVREQVRERTGRSPDVRHAPLTSVAIDGWRGKWYDVRAMEELSDIDFVVVDGPPGPQRSLARFPALPLSEPLLAEQAHIFVDDSARPDEGRILGRWLQRPGVRLVGGGPNWALLVRETSAD